MKLKPLILGLTMGVICVFYMLVINYYPTITNSLSFINQHGHSMRFMLEDLYPIYTHSSFYKVAIGLVLAFIDGFILGSLIGYIYNWLNKKLK